MSLPDPAFVAWFEALYQRHSQELTFQELRRSLTALSKIYTQGRDRLAAGAALTGRGKRAAFALFYGPLHYLLVRHAVQALELNLPTADRSGSIVDLGCGTGVASAAWAKACEGDVPPVLGLDVSSWALQEARFNWQHWGLRGQGRVAKVHGGTLRQETGARAVVAAFAINELDDANRAELLPSLLAAHRGGARVLIMEPIARSLTPWWPVWQQAFEAAGGQETSMRLRLRLPERMALLSRAAGLDHQELTARCLSLRAVPTPSRRVLPHGAAPHV